MAEKVLIINEMEASVLWDCLHEKLKNEKWNVLDEENYELLVFVKNLKEKFENYLDCDVNR